MNLSKLKTEQLQNKIADGKIPADQLEEAKSLLKKRLTKPATEKNAKPVKKATPEEVATEEKKTPAKKKAEPKAKKDATKDDKVAPKKEKKEKKEKAEPKEKAPKTLESYNFDTKTISGLVKTMLMPKEGSKVAGCTYGEANKAVQAKFKRKLHTSEFQRNYKNLFDLGVLAEKLPPRYKTSTEVEEAAEVNVDVQEGKH